uniref:Reverse transcriptase domain-containing protein n=1 Tax=Tanacetum cinerariifolium TaxID=118510 RepID=A0A6L2JVD2_TANCI|nr:hypothetical protein [Tanacetum cinerariifolium]
MSSSDFAVTYTSISSEDVPFWGIRFFGMKHLDSPEVAPQSPIQTPPVPQDEDEREPMLIRPHNPDYVQEPIYPEYIPLEDEHVFLVEEQLLPPVDSPTAESPGYVVELDPKEDPKESGDDDSEDGPVDYPMDEGDDGDDDDGDSSRDDIDDEDEEEEHLASADSAVVVPIIEHASISLPPEAEVERLLAMPTPPPSPLTSLSPPSVGEHLDRIASTQALIDVVTAALPSPLLPPPLYIPPPVDHRDDIPEIELSPRKKSCLFALGPRYEVEESSTARPTEGQGIDDGFVSTLDAKARRLGIREVGYDIRDAWVDPAEAVPEIAHMTLGEFNTMVTELAKLHEHDTHDLYALLEDAQDSICTRVSAPGTSDTTTTVGHQAQMVETLRVMRDMRREMGDMQAKLLALREHRRRARQP